MSTSDSDYSIDWLASDEDDCDRLTPPHADAPPAPSSSSPPPPPSSSSSKSKPTSLRESLPSCFLSAAAQRRRRRSDCKDGGCCGGEGADSPRPTTMASPLETPPATVLSPVQGFTNVCKQQQTLCVESKRHASRKRSHGAALDELCEKHQTDTENQLFSHKCSELQCYVRPLSSILHSLRSGRYSQRLSSFQESVAMDRIQRIMGVLQNPNMGGRFLSIILKIEAMLQSWFPHITPSLTPSDGSTPAKRQKHHHHYGVASPPPSSPASLCSSDSASSYSSSSSTTHLKWFHTSPICSLKTPESTLTHHRPTTTSSSSSSSPLPPRCSREVTQDNSVSSSTDSSSSSITRHRLPSNPRPTAPMSRGPLPFKISSPCLERLLQAKESIIAPRTVGDGGWLS